jgi:hypothetical protein
MSKANQVTDHSGYDRLEDQLQWYDGKSAHNKRMFQRLKAATLVLSVLIPVSVAFVAYYPVIAGVQIGIITGVFGASIALLEGLQQLNQYHQNWISYRATAEALKHEKYLYLSQAGPYLPSSNSKDPIALLAERVESLVSQENVKWVLTQQQSPKSAERPL